MAEPINRSLQAELRLCLECSFSAVRRGATQIRNYLSTWGLPDKEIWACELAFVEGCNNAVQYTPKIHASRKILVELSLRDGLVEFRINDYSSGCEFPAHSNLPPDESESGRGIFLMRSLMDHVSYIRTNSRNCLVLKKSLTGI
jgi:serine/threonine-protein kinase RsbW